MIDKEKPLTTKIEGQQKSDPVYAVNKAGDFSKPSTREPFGVDGKRAGGWPQDADDKRPLSELNDNTSQGAKRFEDAKKRIIQLGEIPRGLPFYSVIAGNDEKDNAMGVINLHASDKQNDYEDRLAKLGDMVDRAMNHPQTIEWPVSRTKLTNAKGEHNESPANRNPETPIMESVPSEYGRTGKKLIKITAERNTDLKVL